MKKIILKRTGHVPLTFEGDLLAAASSNDNNASPSYSGRVGRSQEVSIYQTKGGQYVAAIHLCQGVRGMAVRKGAGMAVRRHH